MDPKVLSVPETLTAAEALDHVRAAPHLAIYYLYIYDEGSRLSGVVNLRELMLADPRTPLTEMMATGVDRLAATADRKAILVHPGWTEYHALPVVDEGGRFVGSSEVRDAATAGRPGAYRGAVRIAGCLPRGAVLGGAVRDPAGMGHVAAPGSFRPAGEDRDAG